jgi:hypothetical protein
MLRGGLSISINDEDEWNTEERLAEEVGCVVLVVVVVVVVVVHMCRVGFYTPCATSFHLPIFNFVIFFL